MNFTAVAIVAICAWALVNLSNGRSKRDKVKGQHNTEIEILNTEISELKERIQTLEKIVTDDNFNLKQQFDELEKNKVA